MQILSHRGYWHSLEERNTKKAFEESFAAGFGTETDLRDICGKIVISHDMPKGGEITFEELLKIMQGRNLPLALNIKADGLIDEILSLLAKYKHTNYFTFDMSIPDMVVQTEKGAKVFTGLSDILTRPVLLDKSAGVWLDAFKGVWYDLNTLDGLLKQGKSVCIVSDDLHGRNTDKQWQMLRQYDNIKTNSLLLCTDKPKEALAYFNGVL